MFEALSSSPQAGDPRGYLDAGVFSDPGDRRAALDRLLDRGGGSPRGLAEVVRSVMIHMLWRSAYGVPADRVRASAEPNLRDLRSKLARLAELEASLGRSPEDLAPLPPERRLIGNCRDHSLLWAALLRAAGIPARLRCGFARYFDRGVWEDHWVVERWEGGRWVIGDAQLDDLMQRTLGFAFDPMEVPDGEFVSGGEAWRACRGGDEPRRYGLGIFCGWDAVKGNLVRDVHALAGRELLSWDGWGLGLVPHDRLGAAELAELDDVASATPMKCERSRVEAGALAGRPAVRWTGRVVSVPAGNPVEVELEA